MHPNTKENLTTAFCVSVGLAAGTFSLAPLLLYGGGGGVIPTVLWLGAFFGGIIAAGTASTNKSSDKDRHFRAHSEKNYRIPRRKDYIDSLKLSALSAVFTLASIGHTAIFKPEKIISKDKTSKENTIIVNDSKTLAFSDNKTLEFIPVN